MHRSFLAVFDACDLMYITLYIKAFIVYAHLFYLYIKDTKNRCNAQLFEAYFKVLSIDWRILSSAEWHIRESSRRCFDITHSRDLPPVCKKDFFDIGNQCFANLQKSKNDAINDGRAGNRDQAGLANAAGASFPATRTIGYGTWPLDRCGGAAAQ